PYTAVAEASLRMVKLAMSSGSRVFMSPSTPSTSTRAEEPAPNVLIPRIQNWDISWPGSPLRNTETIPGTRPPNIFAIEVAGTFSSSTSTLVTAPVTDIFRCVLCPTTMASSNSLTISVSTTRMRSSVSSIGISTFSNPTNENTNMFPSSKSVMLKRPSVRVDPPLVGFCFTVTDTPDNPTPSSDMTKPLAVKPDCAYNAYCHKVIKKTSRKENFLFIIQSLIRLINYSMESFRTVRSFPPAT